MAFQPASSPNYTYPEFVIDARTGRIKINLIDGTSGRVVCHIPSTELHKLVQGYSLIGKTPWQR